MDVGKGQDSQISWTLVPHRIPRLYIWRLSNVQCMHIGGRDRGRAGAVTKGSSRGRVCCLLCFRLVEWE